MFQLASSYVIARQLNRILLVEQDELTIHSVFDFSQSSILIMKKDEIRKIPKYKAANLHVATGYDPEALKSLNTSELCIPNSRVVIHGYLQSWKYIGESFRDSMLTDLLVFNNDVRKAAKTVMSDVALNHTVSMDNVTFVGIHARRGDFVR